MRLLPPPVIFHDINVNKIDSFKKTELGLRFLLSSSRCSRLLELAYLNLKISIADCGMVSRKANESSCMESKISKLPIWKGAVHIEPLSGGITNENFLVTDSRRKAIVRCGEDIPVHHISRINELAAGKAAFAAGLAPEILYSEPGILIIDYIVGRTLTSEDIRKPELQAKILQLIKGCHREIPKHLAGPAPIFWVFHVVRDYARVLKMGQSAYQAKLPELLQMAEELEASAGPFDIVFGHNDLLAANFIDDSKRLWLIDWEYAGFNTPLFDLGGLASNNGFSEEQEHDLLERYFGREVSSVDWRRYQAMKCASLLRETMWSMVSEIHSAIDFDYAEYTQQNLSAFEGSLKNFRDL